MAAAQTFSDDYIWPDKSVTTQMMIGNAVPPKMAKKITSAVLKAL
ncbi:DNA cytosine methyltransferase [Vibrio cholerae]